MLLIETATGTDRARLLAWVDRSWVAAGYLCCCPGRIADYGTGLITNGLASVHSLCQSEKEGFGILFSSLRLQAAGAGRQSLAIGFGGSPWTMGASGLLVDPDQPPGPTSACPALERCSSRYCFRSSGPVGGGGLAISFAPRFYGTNRHTR